jgi:endogenous inhibitor of DNA gyrase (YacG/DUF329 family)
LNVTDAVMKATGMKKILTSEEVPAKRVTCPTCGGDSIYAPSNPSRPFCSARCKNIDLGAWATETFSVPSDALPEDLPVGDARLQ